MKSIFLTALFIISLNTLVSQDHQGDVDAGVIFNSELCVGTGVGNVRVDNSILDANYEVTVGAKLMAAYRFPSHLTIGGMVYYDSYSDGSFLLFGGDVRYFLSTHELSPFLSLNGGYGAALNNPNREGGLFYYPSLGIRVAINGPYAVLFSLGYKNQGFTEFRETEVVVDGVESTVERADDYRVGFLNISIGIIF